MMSAAVRATIGRIALPLDQGFLETMSARWRAAPKEPGGFGPVESAALHYCLLRRSEPTAIARKAQYVICAGQAFAGEDRAAMLASRQRFAALLAGVSPVSALSRMTLTTVVAVNAALSGVSDDGAVALHLAENGGDSSAGPAMTVPEANEALEAGIILAQDAFNRFQAAGLACLDGTTNASASAVASALLDSETGKWLYNEPSLDGLQAARRRDAVREALSRHQAGFITPFEVLRCVGSIDLAVMAGFLLGAACRGLPVMIDGYAATVAVLLARRLAPDSIGVCVFSHAKPAEAHAGLLSLLSVTPILGPGISEEGGYGSALALHELDMALRILGCLPAFATVE